MLDMQTVQKKAKESRSSKPAHLNAPVAKTDPERIKLTLQKQRLKCAQLEQAMSEMCLELEKSSMDIVNELTTDSKSSILQTLK